VRINQEQVKIYTQRHVWRAHTQTFSGIIITILIHFELGNIEKLFPINYLSLIQMSSSSISLLYAMCWGQGKKGIMTVINE
jgi:uncharacterized membrane protein